MPESQDTIKSRMLRTAAQLWDYTGVENEAAFDPLVAMLINACAGELAKINREKKRSQSRLTEEVARLLLDHDAVRTAPAHAIASASPLKSAGYIDEKEQFLCKELQPGSGGEACFSPTARFPLRDTRVKFQASGNTICKIIDHKYKNILGYAAPDKFLPAGTLHVGLDINDKIVSIDEMSLFFNMQNMERRDFFFTHLKNSSWFLNTRELEKKPGYPSTVPREEEDLQKLLTNRYRANIRTCREVNRFYRRQFITLNHIKGLADARGRMPEEIQHAFAGDTLDEVEDDLVWIKAVFPEFIPSKLLDNLFCFTNCFPVLNRQHHDLMFKLHANLNILPLKTDDFFFDIDRIVDSENRLYHNYDAGEEQGTGEEQAEDKNRVLLRSGGVGRFGAFEAREELQYLLETLKDETASYAAAGTEAVESIIGEINALMGDLEEKMAGMTVDHMISYLVMRNVKERETLFVEFWSTAGERANNIAAGTIFEVMGRSTIQPKSTVSITPTVGGKNRLSDEEKLISFKRTLLANDRLVTSEDIKVFCREQLGGRVKQIEITKGLANGMARKEGLVRTIDILLIPDRSVNTSSREWDFLLEDLRAKIRMRTAQSFPYRLMLDKNENLKSVELNNAEAANEKK